MHFKQRMDQHHSNALHSFPNHLIFNNNNTKLLDTKSPYLFINLNQINMPAASSFDLSNSLYQLNNNPGYLKHYLEQQQQLTQIEQTNYNKKLSNLSEGEDNRQQQANISKYQQPQLTYDNKANRLVVPLYCGTCRAYGCNCYTELKETPKSYTKIDNPASKLPSNFQGNFFDSSKSNTYQPGKSAF